MGNNMNQKHADSENERFLEIFELTYIEQAMQGNYLSVGGVIDHIINSGERLPPWLDRDRTIGAIDKLEPAIRETRRERGAIKRRGRRLTLAERIEKSKRAGTYYKKKRGPKRRVFEI
jgi:hypothetical protein